MYIYDILLDSSQNEMFQASVVENIKTRDLC
jgi:hypothetical protein